MQFLKDLNPKQQEAVKTVEGPIMVVAGPGSGKTRVLTYRIAYLIHIGVPASNILALTFTNRAANEMKERIVQLVGDKSKQLWMGTFHSVLAKILRIEGEKIGYERNYTIYDSADSLSLIKSIMSAKGISTQQFNPQAIRARISSAKNQLVMPDDYARRTLDLFEEKTAAVYVDYQKQLKHNNAMDFDDLLLKPIELFDRNKKTLEKYHDRFRFILIDEYQDTNRAQYILIRLLAEKHKNICVVGDDAQSIYAFRGADIRNILDFEHDYPDARLIRLEQNYRSTKTILDAADRVIKHNVDQIAKDLWTQNQAGEKITLLACADDRDEGGTIVQKIYEETHRRKIDLNGIAIMYRTNAQSRAIEDALRRNSIPYVIIGGIEFYQRKEVKDVLAYFRVLVNLRDDESFLRIVNYPSRGIGEAAIVRLRAFANSKQRSLLDAASGVGDLPGVTTKARNGLREVSTLFQKYVQIKSEISISELCRSLVDELGILPMFKNEGTPDAMTRWENVQELLSAITEFSERRSDATLEDFLQDVSLVSDIDEWDGSHNAVTLMTLHSAKGLEFPIVFISGLEEGLLPFSNSALDRKEVEEERRLYYVGITRAMEKLYLSYARARYRFGEVTYQTPSRFLEELSDASLETINNVQRYPARTHHVNEENAARHRKPPKQVDHDHSDVMPDYENDTASCLNLRIGSFVEHETFGKGKILTIAGVGDSMKAVVDFPSVGRKSLLLQYAHLKVL
ncbi:MAG: UvrD-helicase domain-containing protein [Ignavibacteriae bacterium]|nr:UvrD-helicase domain-containing protein [Ignavibacteria bacterium]MBI3365697.1 UvrD-helicase domain-containing protein [Ignavibacteriota bacterium]